MRFNSRILPPILSLVFMVCVCAVAAILICAKCGYENDQGSRFCKHCGAALALGAEPNPAVTTNTPVGGQEAAVAAPVVVSTAVTESELRAASEQLERRNGWLALFYCENAMALNAIAKTSRNLTDRVLQLHEECEAGVRSSVRECRVCDGTGSIARHGNSGDRGESKATCTTCSGTGIVPGRAGLDALKHGYDGAMKMYSVLRMGARWVPAGNAWIPPDLDGKLNHRQIAALKRVTGSRCPNCAGTGQMTCSKCNGLTRVKCPNRQCSNGRVQKKLEPGLGGQERTIMVSCGECGGRGSIKCSGCDGHGSVACKACRGSGILPVCQLCDGEGLKKCSDCKGTGKKKAVVCSGCGGCGSILCRSCMGSGRIRESN